MSSSNNICRLPLVNTELKTQRITRCCHQTTVILALLRSIVWFPHLLFLNQKAYNTISPAALTSRNENSSTDTNKH